LRAISSLLARQQPALNIGAQVDRGSSNLRDIRDEIRAGSDSVARAGPPIVDSMKADASTRERLRYAFQIMRRHGYAVSFGAPRIEITAESPVYGDHVWVYKDDLKQAFVGGKMQVAELSINVCMNRSSCFMIYEHFQEAIAKAGLRGAWIEEELYGLHGSISGPLYEEGEGDVDLAADAFAIFSGLSLSTL
jgi:hypothetical protein